MLERIPDYYEDARAQEAVFRAILKDVKSRFDYVPKDLDPEAELDKIFQTYSQGNRDGRFTITDFKRGPDADSFFGLQTNEARFGMKDIATLSGSGQILKYRVIDDTVEYLGHVLQVMSLR